MDIRFIGNGYQLEVYNIMVLAVNNGTGLQGLFFVVRVYRMDGSDFPHTGVLPFFFKYILCIMYYVFMWDRWTVCFKIL